MAIHFPSFLRLDPLREILDPWGLGVKLNVRHTKYPAWVVWTEEERARNPFVAKFLRLNVTANLVEAHARANAKANETDTSAVSISYFERATENLPVADLLNSRAGLNQTKLGVAVYLLAPEWSGVLDEDGNPVEPTLANRLEMLGWEGITVKVAGNLYLISGCLTLDDKDLEREPVIQTLVVDGAGNDSLEIWRGNLRKLRKLVSDSDNEDHAFQGFTGNPTDAAGRPYLIFEEWPAGEWPGKDEAEEGAKPPPVPWAGEPAGDAWMFWILEAAKKYGDFAAMAEKQVSEDLGLMPSGTDSTGLT